MACTPPLTHWASFIMHGGDHECQWVNTPKVALNQWGVGISRKTFQCSSLSEGPVRLSPGAHCGNTFTDAHLGVPCLTSSLPHRTSWDQLPNKPSGLKSLSRLCFERNSSKSGNLNHWQKLPRVGKQGSLVCSIHSGSWVIRQVLSYFNLVLAPHWQHHSHSRMSLAGFPSTVKHGVPTQ